MKKVEKRIDLFKVTTAVVAAAVTGAAVPSFAVGAEEIAPTQEDTLLAGTETVEETQTPVEETTPVTTEETVVENTLEEGQVTEEENAVTLTAAPEEEVTAEAAETENPMPSYTREEATEKQMPINVAGEEDVDAFISHLVENTEAVQLESDEQLANVLAEKIQAHEGVIVVEQNIDAMDLGSPDSLANKKLVEEMEKQGLSASALISGYTLAMGSMEDGKVTWVLTPYYEETVALTDARNEYIEQVSSYVNTNYTTDVEKLHAVYSYLSQTTVYGQNTSVPSSSPSALIMENQAVCEAFAYLYNEIGTKLGLNMKYVTGTINQSGQEIGHAWNLVELNGEWYNTDATSGNIDREKQNSAEVSTDFFLFSDAIAALTYKRDHDTLPAATSETFDDLYSGTKNFGGGVYENLIVSPNQNEIVIYDVETSMKYTVPNADNNIQLMRTAMVGNELYMYYVDQSEGGFGVKLGKVDVTSLSSGNFSIELIKEDVSGVSFALDGMYDIGANEKIADYSELAIGNALQTNIQLGSDQDFPIEKLFGNYVVQHDAPILASIDNILTSYSYEAVAENGIPAADLEQLDAKFTSLKGDDAIQQRSTLEDLQKLKSTADLIKSYESLDDEATKLLILASIDSISDADIQQYVTVLMLEKTDALEEAENGSEGGDNGSGEQPTNPTPPTDGDGNTGDNGSGEQPTNPTPPTDGDGNTGDNGSGEQPTNPTPPTDGDGNTGDNGSGEQPTNPTPPTNGGGNTGDNGSTQPTPPTNPTPPVIDTPSTGGNGSNTGGTIDNGSNNGGTQQPSTPAQPSTPTETPDDKDETDVTEGTALQLEDISFSPPVGTTGVTLTEENGEFVIKTTASSNLSNTVSATITIPVEKVKGVLKIRTAKGLETVPYTIKDGRIVAQINKAGTIVFVEETPLFEDAKGSQFAEYIQKLANRGIVQGSNGQFNEFQKATRAQFAAMVSRGLGLNESTTTSFSDVAADAWYAGNVGALVELGIVKGANGQFNANDNITRQQAFAMIGRILEAKGFEVDKNASLDEFKDGANVSDYAKPYVSLLVKMGAVSGAKGSLNPYDNITRGQITKVLSIVLEELELL